MSGKRMEQFPLDEFDDDAASRAWSELGKESGLARKRRIPRGLEKVRLQLKLALIRVRRRLHGLPTR